MDESKNNELVLEIISAEAMGEFAASMKVLADAGQIDKPDIKHLYSSANDLLVRPLYPDAAPIREEHLLPGQSMTRYELNRRLTK